jgi:hypothetical protein
MQRTVNIINLLQFFIRQHSVNTELAIGSRQRSQTVYKAHPRTGHEGPEREWRYNSTLSLTSSLDGGVWSTPRPGRFTPGKETRYPLYRRLGRPQGRSGRVRKISPQTRFDPRTVQSVASRYTDWAIPAFFFQFYYLWYTHFQCISPIINFFTLQDFPASSALVMRVAHTAGIH